VTTEKCGRSYNVLDLRLDCVVTMPDYKNVQHGIPENLEISHGCQPVEGGRQTKRNGTNKEANNGLLAKGRHGLGCIL
jgi:hypothetical protein